MYVFCTDVKYVAQVRQRKPKTDVMTFKLARPPSVYEKVEQANYFGWLNYLKHDGLRVADFAFAVPNGSYLHGDISRRAIQGQALRAQGVRAGVPDVFVMVPRAPYHGLAIEFKRIGGSKPGEDQQLWHARLRSQGYYVGIAFGFEAAKKITEEYLHGVQT